MVSITIENVVKTFGTVRAVDNLSLQIEKGELFFLLGPSGCGKTTLLRLIAGFEPPDSGRILFNEADVSHLDAKLRLEMREQIKRIHDEMGLTMVYVTHDQSEALSMASRMVIMQDGHLIQIGTPRDTYNRPINRFVADFIGETNLLLMDIGLISQPIDWFGGGGLLGVVVMEVLHLYPIMYLNIAAALANVDPSMEEAARNVGARGFTLFRRVTFPLMLPGYFAGASIVFIWAFTDLGTPLIFEYRRVVPVQIFNPIWFELPTPVFSRPALRSKKRRRM